MSYLDEQNVHVFTHAPYSPDLKFSFSFFFPDDEAETGRADVFNDLSTSVVSELMNFPIIVPEDM